MSRPRFRVLLAFEAGVEIAADTAEDALAEARAILDARVVIRTEDMEEFGSDAVSEYDDRFWAQTPKIIGVNCETENRKKHKRLRRHEH